MQQLNGQSPDSWNPCFRWCDLKLIPQLHKQLCEVFLPNVLYCACFFYDVCLRGEGYTPTSKGCNTCMLCSRVQSLNTCSMHACMCCNPQIARNNNIHVHLMLLYGSIMQVHMDVAIQQCEQLPSNNRPLYRLSLFNSGRKCQDTCYYISWMETISIFESHFTIVETTHFSSSYPIVLVTSLIYKPVHFLKL